MKIPGGARPDARVRKGLSILVSLMMGTAFAAGCSDAVPEAGPVPPSAVADGPAGAVDVAAAPGAPAPPSALRRAVAPVRRELRNAASATAATAAPSADAMVPLESLRPAPYGSGGALQRPLDPLGPREPSSAPEAHASPFERWKDLLRVERRSEAIGPAGPRQGALSSTEAGLRIPLDDAVSLDGGVRVDQRSGPDMQQPERSSSPRVGLEVRF
jgi:hypothetical protein